MLSQHISQILGASLWQLQLLSTERSRWSWVVSSWSILTPVPFTQILFDFYCAQNKQNEWKPLASREPPGYVKPPTTASPSTEGWRHLCFLLHSQPRTQESFFCPALCFVQSERSKPEQTGESWLHKEISGPTCLFTRTRSSATLELIPTLA